jgi:hypothetical protein
VNPSGANQHSTAQWAGGTSPGQVQAYAMQNIRRELENFVLAAASGDAVIMLKAAQSIRAVCTRLEAYARIVGRRSPGKGDAKSANNP